MLCSGLVSRVGTSHRVNLIALLCIGEKVLLTKDVRIIFSDFVLLAGTMVKACAKL